MSKLRREVGFWPLTLGLRVREYVVAPEFAAALVIGLGGSYWFIKVSELSDRTSVALDYLVIVGPLLGIVFAAMALVVSLLATPYLRLLNEHPEGGVKRFLAPFMTASGLQVGSLLSTIAYRAVAKHLSEQAEQAAFILLSFLFVYATLDIVAIARVILMHAMMRARSAELE